MAEKPTDTQRAFKVALFRLTQKIGNQFPQYPHFASKFQSICKEEEFDEIPVLIDDVNEGFAESVLLEQIGDAIDIKDCDKEPLCDAILHVLSTFKYNLEQIVTKVDKNELKLMKETVEKTANLLKPQSMKDRDLLKVLIIGKKNDFPLLTYLLDTYARCRVLVYIEIYQKLATVDTKRKRQRFIAQSFVRYDVPAFLKHCEGLKRLKERANHYPESKKALQWMEASLNSVFRRMPSPLGMSPQEIVWKIDDNITIYAKYYISILTAVHHILKDTASILPLQIDFWVIPKAMKYTQLEDEEDAIKSDDSIEDTDDDEDEEHKEAQISDLEPRLKHTKNLVRKDIGNIEIDVLSAMLCEICNDVIKKKNSKRMVMIVDRRKEKEEKEEKATDDKLYAFLTKKTQNIPTGNYLQESLFNLSSVEVLPSENGKIDPERSNAIHVHSIYMQNMCLLSLHLHSKNEVRAYWYLNGSYTRWFVNDMVDIWPLYFVEKDMDEKTRALIYQDVEPIKKLIKQNEEHMPLKDDGFDAFFEVNTESVSAVTALKT